NDNQKTKNISFEITDGTLIKTTGGIVQGMSGSPIIQDEYIVGAITHVVIDNPTRGYGIFITNMLEEAEN
ncbi:MAG: SpoIVB peptidase S55 domain-containing protein, partial [Bacilli bacterium]|nr:SpoIVB peptidase S55 domain-containing protein [Bacilli bacterium]